MEGSIEMKRQILDKMLDVREQMVALENDLGIYHIYVDGDSDVLFHNKEEFFYFAKLMGAKVESDYEKDEIGDISVKFIYREVTFKTFLNEEESQLYQHEIARSDADVL